MNSSIRKLFFVVVALIAVLLFFTARWTVISRGSLDSNPRNRLSYYASLKIKRGSIVTAGGQVLAFSSKASDDLWSRQYPFGPLFAQAVGYANPANGEFTGIENYRNSVLSGKQSGALSSVFGSLHSTTAGDQVDTTLDYKAQAQAKTLLEGYTGSIVALVPQTGAVKVMYSNPTYSEGDYAGCIAGKVKGCSLTNGAVGGLGVPPGSTFKVVTAAAALDSGGYTPDSKINAPKVLTVADKPLHNDINENLGYVTLTYALTNSINTVFAQVGLHLGAQKMETYMRRFGFYSPPPLDYPANEMSASGPKQAGQWNLLPMSDTDQVDLGRTAIGQAKLLVTPLQMAMVASTVANGGVLMEPRLVSKVVNQDGQTVQSVKPTTYDRVMKASTAAELTQMMTDVVEEGTGQAAQLDGVQVAGKTGTATVYSVKGVDYDDAWFIGFAPVKNPKIAVAVELSNIKDGYGGQYAAPRAAQIIKTLLAEGQ